MHIEDEIRNLLEKEVEKKDVRIDSIKLEKEDNNLFLRIVIDSDEIIDVDIFLFLFLRFPCHN